MADKKISALTGATTPLAGTEVLPIVQGGSTVKVANNDLRPKQIQSNATSGVLQIAGPASAATRVMTTPDANFTAARTDAAQSLTGDQTLATGNLIQGTAAKGVNFTANTPAAGMTSQLLNAYEEGTWTPTIGNGSLTVSGAVYTRVGRLVTVQVNIASITDITTAAAITISGLPFASKSGTYSTGSMFGRYWNTGSQMLAPYIPASSSSITFYAMTLGANYATVNHNNISNGAIETFITIQYVTS
jgi:hypothetical protein